MVPAKVGSTPVLFLAELDGSVSCYTTEGKKLWRNPTDDPAVMFEIRAADLDGDGRDELVTASGDGTISCWDSSGKLLWKFRPERKVRFNTVAVLARGKHTRVFAGGNDRTIYVLDRKGKELSKKSFKAVIRKLELGDFQVDGEELLFVHTLEHDKYRWGFFGLLNPDNLDETIIELPASTEIKRIRSGMITDLRAQDLDHDDRDDLLAFNAFFVLPSFTALNGNFEEIAGFDVIDNKLKKVATQRYGHSTGTSLYPVSNEILLQYGQAYFVLDAKGNVLHANDSSSYRFPASDICLHPSTNLLYAAGSTGGDNAVYVFDPSKKNWWKENTKWEGRLAEVTENLETLYDQAIVFEPPAYQQPSQKPFVMNYGGKIPKEVQNLDYNKIIFLDQKAWSEDYDRSDILAAVGEEYASRRDKRKPYTDKHEDLVRKAKAYEKSGTPFLIWAGHGTDPFYVSIDSLEAILEAAPETCYGFIYAEMANPEDPRVHYFIKHYMPRLAAACRKNGKAKLHFRYKQTFWATTVHADIWQELFLSGKYADILVPATEDTNSTTQELNLAGRVGMYVGGYVDDFGMRLIDDNPTGWRPTAPCRQKTVSPYLRSGVIRAAYGARYGILVNPSYVDGPGLEVMFALMKSGVLPVVEPDMIASIGSWHLIDDIDEEILMKDHSGHDITNAADSDVDQVISAQYVTWAGSSTTNHDFSRIGLGVDYRWLNFVPKLPHGMVPIASAGLKQELEKSGTPFIVSDVKHGKVGDQLVPAREFGQVIKKTVAGGAADLPVVVSGASWSAIQLDDSHYRLVLLDPYYIDPRDCEVTITFQPSDNAQGKPKWVKDILSGEQILVKGGQAKLTVPAGSIRFIDFAL